MMKFWSLRLKKYLFFMAQIGKMVKDWKLFHNLIMFCFFAAVNVQLSYCTSHGYLEHSALDLPMSHIVIYQDRIISGDLLVKHASALAHVSSLTAAAAVDVTAVYCSADKVARGQGSVDEVVQREVADHVSHVEYYYIVSGIL